MERDELQMKYDALQANHAGLQKELEVKVEENNRVNLLFQTPPTLCLKSFIESAIENNEQVVECTSRTETYDIDGDDALDKLVVYLAEPFFSFSAKTPCLGRRFGITERSSCLLQN
jgi:hypothetical protein